MQNVNLQKATFGAGCFWGVEAAFRQVKGVTSTAVGYSGGHFDNPTYEDVCRGKTGHAEVVEVEYNPAIVSYNELLNVFWNKHNPTASNHQELDVGYQYRSVIFFHTPEQELLARASKEQLENSSRYHKNPIVTEIVAVSQFYRAEEYHQQYQKKHGRTSYKIG
ncbi:MULTISPECIES: peptide-methionine (S)-S-oxide reductase MsrA [unclassified Nostoc]|uniref:peptide-methionine (S)-S-oxide reductase MsrA n=1 Tax=unclassified Nostoc TaxID=2593658 RepID=UPI002AD2E08D|nr:peptide-methionine (S)-S-oxide reductase MsrA [Nostoc sp. DedQUE03]MDZ7977491.1 peptide-methionine (S)-S-oxide reductase MsrA [Nostoc sp. DedQUE03]MDZ8047370.1 peptide-methionine (S)-S-oxide reductase MsrA [Nostoc sp. DedQUE02]